MTRNPAWGREGGEAAAWIDSAFGREVDFLSRLVAENSWSHNHPGVDRVGEMTRRMLESFAMICRVEELPGSGKALVCRTRSAPDGVAGHLLILAHLDTVYPPDGPRRPLRAEGRWYSGNGCADDKGGIAASIFALGGLYHAGVLDGLPIVAVFTPDEELGTPRGGAVVMREAKEAAAVLVAELGHPREMFINSPQEMQPAPPIGGQVDGGSIVTSRYGWGFYRVHAEPDPDSAPDVANSMNGEGETALLARIKEALPVPDPLAAAPLAMLPMPPSSGDGSLACEGAAARRAVLLKNLETPEKECFVRVAPGWGWRKPGTAGLDADGAQADPGTEPLFTLATRFLTRDGGIALENGLKSLLALPFADHTGLRLAGGIGRPPLERTPAVVALAETYRKLAAGLGCSIFEERRRSTSDGCLAPAGIPVLDGLAPVGRHMHTPRETVSRQGLRERTILLAGMILALAERK